MERKETKFAGTVINGFVMLSVTLATLAASIALIIWGGMTVSDNGTTTGVIAIVAGIAAFIAFIILLCGFVLLEPGEARMMMFFGEYRGTFTETGYFWVHPFITTKRLSLSTPTTHGQ